MFNLFGLSPQQAHFAKTSRCPNGHLLFGSLILKDPEGNGISILTPYPLLDKGATATCPKCNETWAVFGKDDTAALPKSPEWRITDVRETHRFEEPLGTDRQSVDQKGFSGNSTQRLSFSRQWRQSFSVESEKSTTTRVGGEISLMELAKLEASAETMVRESYVSEESAERTSSRELEVEVPGGTAVEVLFHWKKVWQGGVVVFTGPEGATLEMPFAVAVDVAFDQEMRNI